MATTKKPRVGNLTSIEAILRETRRIYRECRCSIPEGELSSEDLVRLSGVLFKMHQMIDGSKIENEMIEVREILEKQQQQINKRRK